MELLQYTDADLTLTEAIECDPQVMSKLGGPIPRRDVLRIHRMRLAGIADGSTWWFKIAPDPSEPSAGTIGIWESSWNGATIHETGWMLLPAFQGRGLASEALGLLLDLARDEPRFQRLHAFPATSNAPSNALCRKFGFTRTEECDLEFRDRPLHCNHWELDVSS